jgi:predicted kinase
VAADRAARRVQDSERVSDATPDIVLEQFRTFEPLDEIPASDVLALSTEPPLEVQAADVALAVDRRGQSTHSRSAPAADAAPTGRA